MSVLEQVARPGPRPLSESASAVCSASHHPRSSTGIVEHFAGMSIPLRRRLTNLVTRAPNLVAPATGSPERTPSGIAAGSYEATPRSHGEAFDLAVVQWDCGSRTS